jgi:glycosyltransferase involved in cell wall biosynthesis
MNECMVEIRVPTYKRNKLLRRALTCLQNQTWQNWRAIVYDDSKDRNAEILLSEIDDKRITYQHNKNNLGAAKNLDQSFQFTPVLGGRYAFVLEDDNGIKPDFIELNVSLLSRYALNLLLREQEIYDEDQQGIWQPTGNKTKDRLFKNSGVYSASYVQGTIFFNDCTANGGLFWDTENCRSNLVVGEHVEDSGLQEYCRTIQITEPIVYGQESLGIWTRGNSSVRSFINNRIHGRAVQALQQALLDWHGKAFASLLWQTADALDMIDLLRNNLAALASVRHSIFLRHNAESTQLLLKGLVKKLIIKNSLRRYLTSRIPRAEMD